MEESGAANLENSNLDIEHGESSNSGIDIPNISTIRGSAIMVGNTGSTGSNWASSVSDLSDLSSDVMIFPSSGFTFPIVNTSKDKYDNLVWRMKNSEKVEAFSQKINELIEDFKEKYKIDPNSIIMDETLSKIARHIETEMKIEIILEDNNNAMSEEEAIERIKIALI